MFIAPAPPRQVGAGRGNNMLKIKRAKGKHFRSSCYLARIDEDDRKIEFVMLVVR